MITQGLKFFAATTLIVISAFYIDFVYLDLLERMFLFVVNLSHDTNWLFSFLLMKIMIPSLVILSIVIAMLPIGIVSTPLKLFSFKNTNMILLFSLYYCVRVFYDFKLVFFTPHINIMTAIGQDFLYYTGAVVTFFLIIYTYISIIQMLLKDKND